MWSPVPAKPTPGSRQHGRGQAPPLRGDAPTGRRGAMPRRGDPCGRPCRPNQMPGSRQHGRGQAPPLPGHAPTGRRGAMPRRGDPCGRPCRPNQHPDHVNTGGDKPRPSEETLRPADGGQCLVGATLVVARNRPKPTPGSRQHGRGQAPPLRGHAPTGRRGAMPRRGDPCGRPCRPNQMPGSRQHGRGQAPPLPGHAPTGRRGECLVGATLVVARAGQNQRPDHINAGGGKPAPTGQGTNPAKPICAGVCWRLVLR